VLNLVEKFGGLFVVGAFVFSVSSCTKQEESQSSIDPNQVSISGKLESEQGGLKLDESMAFSCVSLGGEHEMSSSNLSSNGEFRVDVNKDSLFSCYLNNEDGDHLASMIVGDSSEDNSGNILTDGGSAISLKKSAELGSLEVRTNGVIVAEEEKFGDSISIKDPYISVEELDGKTFKLTCAGASSQDKGCLQQIAETPSVFFAKIEPSEGNEETHVLVAWDSQGDYESCGQISTYEQTTSKSGEVSERSQTYNFNDADCNTTSNVDGRPTSRHGIAEITSVGKGYSYRSEEILELSEGCVEYDVFSIDFTGEENSMSGIFKKGSKFDGSCPDKYEDDLEVYFVNIEILPENSEKATASSEGL
jgi:hypothetical protein